MALFKSQLATQISGSVGGTTYTRTPSGMVMRARSMPVNPATERQQVVRNAVSQLNQQWVEELTEEERQSWNTYAANVPRKNKLGDTFHLSGINEFVRSNVPRIQAGAPIIKPGPTIFDSGIPITDAIVEQEETTPFAVNVTFGTVAGYTTVIYLSKPQNPSINFFKGPYQFYSGGLGPTFQIDDGQGWVAGQKIFIRMRRSNIADGRLSSAYELSIILSETPVVAP